MNRPIDNNLLFGILALQNHVIDQSDLIAAFHDWSTHQNRPLAEIMLGRKLISREDVALVNTLMARHLKHHGGDARTSLIAVADTTARQVIRSVDHQAFRASLTELPPEPGHVRFDTLIGPVTEKRDRYSLSHVHGEGGLGRIWLARDLDLNRPVALKEIRPTKSTDKSAWSRFLKEAQITGQLEHPGIVPVYELAKRTEDDQPYYTMRFVDGGTLGSAIQQHHKRRREGHAERGDFRDLLHAFVYVCQAIGYAHSRGVIHRDLKPENIVKGDYGVVMVLDWGLAKLIDRPEDPLSTIEAVVVTENAAMNQTVAHSTVGTPQYMAPEQAAGELELIDNRTDVYGLGAILFEILTDHPPHEGPNLQAVLKRIREEETPRASAHGTHVPRELEAIALKAMAKKREDRYQSSEELAADVQRYLDDEPVSVHRESLSKRASRWARKNRVLVQSSVAILLISTVAATIAALFVYAAKRETEQSYVREQKARKDAETAKLRVSELLVSEKKARQDAEQAQQREKADKERAEEEAAKSRALIGAFVEAFRTSDPLGMNGFGLKLPGESAEKLTARDILDRSVVSVNRLLADQPRIQASLLDTIGDVYRARSETDRAKPALEKALAIRERVLGPDSSEVADTLTHLGWLQQDLSNFEEAERLFHRSLSIRKAKYDEDSLEVIDSKHHLALLCLFGGESEKAIPLFEEVIASYTKKHRDKGHDLAIARLGYAAALLDMNKLARGLYECNRAVWALRNQSGSNRLFLAITKYQNGYVQKTKNLYESALNTFRDGLTDFEAILGPNHAYLSFFIFEIADVEASLNRDTEAEKHYAMVLDLLRKSVGLRHPRSDSPVLAYARFLENRGRTQQARAICNELIDARRKAYGEKNAYYAESKQILALIVEKHQDYAEATALHREACDIYNLPANRRYSINRAVCMENLANRLLRDGLYEEAAAIFREVYPTMVKGLGQRTHTPATIQYRLSRCMIALDQEGNETDQLLNDSSEVLRGVLDEDPIHGVHSTFDLAESDLRRGRRQDSEEHAKLAMETASRVLKNQPDNLVLAMTRYAGFSIESGDLLETKTRLDAAVELIRKHPSARSKDVIAALSTRAVLDVPAEYPRKIKALLKEFGATRDAPTLNELTWAAARSPSHGLDAATLENLATQTLLASPTKTSQKTIAAAALFRAGRFERALELLERNEQGNDSKRLYDDVLLAMVRHRLGQNVKARASLGRAIALEKSSKSRLEPWSRRLVLKQLIEEAGTMLNEPNIAFPDDVFAH